MLINLCRKSGHVLYWRVVDSFLYHFPYALINRIKVQAAGCLYVGSNEFGSLLRSNSSRINQMHNPTESSEVHQRCFFYWLVTSSSAVHFDSMHRRFLCQVSPKNSCIQPSIDTATNTITDWLNVGCVSRRRLKSPFLAVIEVYI